MTKPEMQTRHWYYYHGKPTASGKLKVQPEDFKVQEILTFEPLGEGEHVFVWIQKTELNTAYVAEQLAKFAEVPLRNVSYAGRKDKYAVTEQWFSIHLPGLIELDWQKFSLPGAKVLRSDRHHKKLRSGNLDCNLFKITIRDLDHTEDLEKRLQAVRSKGVPNYFGSQRFGEIRASANAEGVSIEGGNLALAQKMLEGEVIRNRNKRSMAISALRSWLFNQFVHERISQQLNQNQNEKNALPGDILVLSGSNSFFNCEVPDAMIQNRLKEQDLQLSAPMWGKGDLSSSLDAAEIEQSVAKEYPEQCQLLEELGLKQERRPIWLYPLKMQWQLKGDTLQLEFFLPPGSYATSVLREIINTK